MLFGMLLIKGGALLKREAEMKMAELPPVIIDSFTLCDFQYPNVPKYWDAFKFPTVPNGKIIF